MGTYLARFDTNYVENNFAMDLRMDVYGAKVMEGFTNFMAGSDKMMPWTQVANL